MALIERIITVYNDKGSKQAIKDINKLEDTFVNAGKKIAKGFGIAALAVGALAVKLGKDAVAGAIEDQKAQAALATALQNTIGATDDQIASVTKYLDSLELQVGVNNNELIPSLQSLIQATGDVTQAQGLQALALDISAGTGRDLVSVTNALVRSLGGNLGALKRLGIPLDDTIIKNKDLNAALMVLSKTFDGQASKRAETFEYQMERLRLQFDQTLDSLGYALIPVLEELAEVFRTQVLPVFEKFIADNKDQIAEGLRSAANAAIGAAKAFGDMFKVIADNFGVIKAFIGLMVATFVGTKVAAGIQLIAAGIAGLTTLFRKQAAAGTAAGVATAFATGGTSAIAAAAGLAAFTAAAGLTYVAMNKMTDSINLSTSSMVTQSQVVQGHLKDLKNIERQVAAVNLKNLKTVTITTNLNKKTAEQIALEKALAKLKKMGVVPTTEKDPIQLEAARLNLLRQGRIAEAERVKAMQDAIEVQKKLNEQAQRYADILQVLSDQVISDEEVAVLAQKWDMAKSQVLEYIARIYSANSTPLDEGPIVKLLMAWGLTAEEARKYIDFTRALKDEKIDDKEIEELMGKWGMTRAEVVGYAKQVQDGTALQKVLAPTWAQPGDAAAEAWKRALAALNAYLAALNNQPKPTTPTTPTTPTKPTTPTTPAAPKVEGDGNVTIVTPGGQKIPVTPETFKVGDANIIKGIGTPLTSKTDDTVLEATARQRIADIFETIGQFGAGGFNAPTSVTVNVAGNVVTEQDLTDGILDGLYQYQKQGRNVTYVAVAL